MENIKVALVHDWLTGQRGGEKVLEVFSEIFPHAPIYTLIHFPGSQIMDIEKKRIVTSFIQKFPFLKKKYRFYLPFYPLAMEMFNLQEYDMLLSSSHCVAKGVIPRPDAMHISYIHSPIRYAWNHYFSYFSQDKLGVFSRFLIPQAMHKLRLWDAVSADRVDHFVANSKTVAKRIEKYYRRSAEVIHPPVDTQFYHLGGKQENYYLIVSALVPYKQLELAVEAFNRCGETLKIVGQGPDYSKLKKQANANIKFLGTVGADDLLQLYRNARALILPGEEDFGINVLESQACGVPVIAYRRGGATETVIAGKTGVFFTELKVSSLINALDKFKHVSFNKKLIRENALNFSREKFKETISAYLLEKWTRFKEQND